MAPKKTVNQTQGCLSHNAACRWDNRWPRAALIPQHEIPRNKQRKQLRKVFLFLLSVLPCRENGGCGGGLTAHWSHVGCAPIEYSVVSFFFFFCAQFAWILEEVRVVCGSLMLISVLLYFYGSLKLMWLHGYAFGEFWHSRALTKSTQSRLRNSDTNYDTKWTGCAPALVPTVPSCSITHSLTHKENIKPIGI